MSTGTATDDDLTPYEIGDEQCRGDERDECGGEARVPAGAEQVECPFAGDPSIDAAFDQAECQEPEACDRQTRAEQIDTSGLAWRGTQEECSENQDDDCQRDVDAEGPTL